jgi:tRNA U34 5-methylaminomethyl-2-thiouridine-forming methyltransferase MnmC
MVLGNNKIRESEPVKTADGSSTLFIRSLGEPYHSMNGALTESNHVFVKNGLLFCQKRELIVFEVGFGTGLNCLLTAMEAASRGLKIIYIAVEKFPLDEQILKLLNYPTLIAGNAPELWEKIHSAKWGVETKISDCFSLLKLNRDFTRLNYDELQGFDVIYFDAFAPAVQPEMWESGIFSDLYKKCNEGAILTTYCAKGEVRRRMVAAGFKVDRTPGPPGKKEMLMAIKTTL